MRTFRTLSTVPTLRGMGSFSTHIGGMGELDSDQGFDWGAFFGTPAGQATIANALNMVTHATGAEAVYPVTAAGGRSFIAGNAPVVPQGLLFAGIALGAFLLLKK